MTKEKFWSTILAKHSHLLNDTEPCKFTNKGLRQLVDLAYDKGKSEGIDIGLRTRPNNLFDFFSKNDLPLPHHRPTS